MFERLSPEAKRIVTGGVEIALRLRHHFLGTEHLLIALAGTGPNVATRAMIACGFDPARAQEDLEMLVESSGDDLNEADAAALRSIGVDLDEVRRRTEASFGPDALEAADARASAASRSCRRRSRRSSSPFAKRSGWNSVRSDPSTCSSACFGSMRRRPSSSEPRRSTPAGSAPRSSVA